MIIICNNNASQHCTSLLVLKLNFITNNRTLITSISYIVPYSSPLYVYNQSLVHSPVQPSNSPSRGSAVTAYHQLLPSSSYIVPYSRLIARLAVQQGLPIISSSHPLPHKPDNDPDHHHNRDNPYHDVEGQQAVACLTARHTSLLVLLAGEVAFAEDSCAGGAVGGIDALRVAGAVEGAVVTVLVAADRGFVEGERPCADVVETVVLLRIDADGVHQAGSIEAAIVTCRAVAVHP
jgi:hypothetical protein